jgi:23S rRNA pseudouridine1911/1915/1917 synthase
MKAAAFDSNRVLFEDNHLIIINKLPSEIVQGDKTGDMPLSEIIKEYIKIKYNKPGKVFLGVVHRLDRPVSGAVIFARTGKALSRMNELIRERNISKTYWAIVKDKPPEEEGLLVHYLRKNEEKNMSRAYPLPGKDRLKAELKYRVIDRSDNYYLLEVELLTGRHHQIRVQLAAIGCPVKGDLKYGFPRSNPNGSIHLHSRKVEFIHPVKGEVISLVAKPPLDPLWNYFEQNAD